MSRERSSIRCSMRGALEASISSSLMRAHHFRRCLEAGVLRGRGRRVKHQFAGGSGRGTSASVMTGVVGAATTGAAEAAGANAESSAVMAAAAAEAAAAEAAGMTAPRARRQPVSRHAWWRLPPWSESHRGWSAGGPAVHAGKFFFTLSAAPPVMSPISLRISDSSASLRAS